MGNDKIEVLPKAVKLRNLAHAASQLCTTKICTTDNSTEWQDVLVWLIRAVTFPVSCYTTE